MTSALNITQVILGALVMGLILSACWCAIFSLCDHILSKSFERGKQAQFEIDARRLRESAMWFSEDRATMDLIRSLAESGDMQTIRHNWKKTRGV